MADSSVDMINNLLGISPPKGRRVPENQTTQEKELDSAWTTKMENHQLVSFVMPSNLWIQV